MITFVESFLNTLWEGSEVRGEYLPELAIKLKDKYAIDKRVIETFIEWTGASNYVDARMNYFNNDSSLTVVFDRAHLKHESVCRFCSLNLTSL